MLIPLAFLALSALPVETIEVPVDAPARRTIEFEEVWRTDPESDEYLIGRVSKMVMDDEGCLYVLEDQLLEVLKFDAAGNFVDTVARRGEGPGEIEKVSHMVFWPPNTLVLARGFPPRVVCLTKDGTPQDQLHIYRNEGDDAEAQTFRLMPAGDNAVITASTMERDGMESTTINWVGVIDRDGNVLREFGEHATQFNLNPAVFEYDETAGFWPWSRWTLSADGHLFRVPDREVWRIERSDLEGNPELAITCDVEPRARTKEELAERKKMFGGISSGRGIKTMITLFDTHPACSNPQIVNGQLWVSKWVPEEERSEGLWFRSSVISFDGELIEEVDLVLDIDSDLDGVTLMPDGSVVVVENGSAAWAARLAAIQGKTVEGDDEPISIVMYRPRR